LCQKQHGSSYCPLGSVVRPRHGSCSRHCLLHWRVHPVAIRMSSVRGIVPSVAEYFVVVRGCDFGLCSGPYRSLRHLEQGQQMGLHWRFDCGIHRRSCCVACHTSTLQQGRRSRRGMHIYINNSNSTLIATSPQTSGSQFYRERE
jgi:hypothetical protein